ncbi:lipoprotein precursor [Escherichia coli O127:H6]|uniref:Predicted lipoprotein n=1 Tax=Escherichia coli O127:H6 (strain E2348/69 / EPEC) TaxID=574521 RepID=B7UGP6_ECO27|nr:predicted lipoprotein precursor [Escherichia coli O127:H6 str. E2348/69]SLM07676.1 lipoprotein precursor [Escherichia coli O127:H6]SNU20510.1 lipoprotein precursor [Escherichia coli O127:H6]
MNVKRSRGSTRRAMMLLMLPLALAGCSNSSLPSVSSSGSITPLSALGRQPQIPEFCLPTCSANLSSETDSWQSTLTGPQKPDESVKSSTIR